MEEKIIIIEEKIDDKNYKKLDGEWRFIKLPNLPPVDCSKGEVEETG